MSNKSAYVLKKEGRESPVRRLGLGATCCDDTTILSTLRDAMGCSMTALPNIESTTWDINGPVLDTNLTESFGDEIDIFNSGKQVNGVDTVQTTFVHPGILQTGIIVVAVGVHVYAEPLCFTAEGNSFPAPTTGVSSPASPDVFTGTDTASLTAGLRPSILSWGWPMQYASWLMANAYNLDWIVRNRYHLISEPLRDVGYFGSFAEENGAGTSQVDVMEFARRTNDHYRSLLSSDIFLPINRRRQGEFAGASVWRPTRDYDLANVTWGGLAVQDKLCNGPFRKLTLPYFIPCSSPIGLQLNESNKVKGDLFRQQLSISNSLNGSPVPPNVSPDRNINAGLDVGVAELSLDATAAAVTTNIEVGRVLYKGGELLISMMIKGFEVTDDFATAMQSPSLKVALQSEFGLQYCC